MASTLPRLPLFEAIAAHDLKSTAVVHNPSGRAFTYGELAHDVANAIEDLRGKAGGKPLVGERVAFLVENGYDYLVTLLSIFATHAIAVPLCTTHPDHELRYIIDHSSALMLLASSKFEEKAHSIIAEGTTNKPIIGVEKILAGSKSAERIDLVDCDSAEIQRGGLMLYTSGTTSRPKGVVLPQSAQTAQSRSLLQAWNYTKSDRLLHVLPLHHIHGVVNALLTPLFVGASIEFLFPFNAQAVWDRFAAPFLTPKPNSPTHVPISFFTVVPTVYNRLISLFPTLPQATQDAIRTATSPNNLRLNISGSAALPTPTKAAWSAITNGNVLLERYGMTEIVMGLSCGLDPSSRIDGSVGWPLPGVQVRLVDVETSQIIAEGQEVTSDGKERLGEIQIKGATVFKEYWANPNATQSEFVDGWFKTGDVAIRRQPAKDVANKEPWQTGWIYYIQGRLSSDIIKTGGEKVSALEVEREMLALAEVSEVAVVAVPSDVWGQKVSAIVVLSEKGKTAGKEGGKWSKLNMRQALRDKLANYKIPLDMKVVEALERNAMGKVNKKELVKVVYGL
jgi:malonyl-CoA/methylmalonyl-CoA synthetase